jgi:hypothetical protein
MAVSQRLQEDIPDNRNQPASRRPGVTQLMTPLMGEQKCLLNQIFRIIGVSRQSIRISIQQRRVLFDKFVRRWKALSIRHWRPLTD